MRWLVILIAVGLVAVAAWRWLRSRRTAADDRLMGDLAASVEARRRLDDHHNPTDGSNLRSSGGGIL